MTVSFLHGNFVVGNSNCDLNSKWVRPSTPTSLIDKFQQCSRNKEGTYVCTASIEAALGTVPCTYDYECSGGENCVNIADQKKEKVSNEISNFVAG